MTKNLAGGFQWAIFLIASSIAAPIAIANIFGMDTADTALFLQRTIFVLGIACLIQAFIGHRLPINEGPAGLWWGVFIVYAGLVGVLYSTAEESLQVLQSGLFYSGILFIVFAVTGVVDKLKQFFTPTVTFIYLLLLVLQISESIMKGLFGISSEGDLLDVWVLLAAVAVILITFYFMFHRSAFISRYSVLLSIAFGWLLFWAIGKAPSIPETSGAWITFPDMLVFGPLVFDGGMFVTTLFLTVLLIANMMASVHVMESLLKNAFSIQTEDRMKQASVASGLNHLLAGLFSSVGPVPISGAAGFVSATRTPGLRPFIVGGVIVTGISLFPQLMAVLASLPAPVAYAVIFAIFSKMVEMAFNALEAEENRKRSYKVSAFGLMTGVGLMFIPTESMAGLPSAVAAILSNGLITGTIIAIIIEQVMMRFVRVK
ncbi:purine/pyrimidine permease [Planococcus sp. CP5-4]|uniref:purine/pyrimidine permease n=1 Tax=unclassified Planococcus (in: firmicutes) TaxID=2662419 RepID=UPI001C221E2D|nr:MULTISPECIES: purine/pyrimidine permease [unclassified Planococcus (in: firmicutes)]MBU9672480.1 purine/pyrimidine permease [Planococcus sp. CP5-4_YE]MBV0909530.1 purine/pyrimidine permease [Planococcus sp. CP5-4_UN]MBW6064260.1 purine/pyrimidine permease [Planococcus sp. CP5-4]